MVYEGAQPEFVVSFTKQYKERMDEFGKELLDQLDSFNDVVREIRRADIRIVNASGNSLYAVLPEFERLKQMGYLFCETKNSPGVSQLKGKKCVMVTVSGSGKGTVAENAAKFKELKKNYSDKEFDLTSIGVCSKPDSDLKKYSDIYVVLTGNNKGSDIKVTNPFDVMGERFEKKAGDFFNAVYCNIFVEDGWDSDGLKEGHNPFN